MGLKVSSKNVWAIFELAVFKVIWGYLVQFSQNCRLFDGLAIDRHGVKFRSFNAFVSMVKEVGHTFVVMVCILPIFNSLGHHFRIVIFDA